MELISLYIYKCKLKNKEFSIGENILRSYDKSDNWNLKNRIVNMITDLCKIHNHTVLDFYIYHYFDLNFDYENRMDFEHVIEINYSMYHNYGHTLEDLAIEQTETTFNSMFSEKILNNYGNIYKYLRTKNINDLNSNFYFRYLNTNINYKYLDKNKDTNKDYKLNIFNRIKKYIKKKGDK